MLESANHNVIGDNAALAVHPHDIVRVPKVEFDESGFEREVRRRKFARAACVLRGRHIPSKPNIGFPHHVMWLL